ncbi:SCO family protein [Paraconexibacter algicola]|uniref:Thioredoxin domain-containing protein n=1 Tax=Paraconexibacter algicola TaxID=2133960 RepID=A0A2T4UF46_9ACTN|nr:SCO family protein [Paraconexibacter algicola]PTL56398.1 hypothetical protein C7Y72_15660 [Paraconexibacter algicola]
MRVTRLHLALATLLACTFAALCGALLATAGQDDEPTQAPGFRGALAPAGVPPKDFRLRDQDGRVASLKEYRGKVVALTFLYTTCEDTCPIAADQIRAAFDRLGHDVPALAVSVDPANDDADQARKFLLKRRLTNGRMRFLLGDRQTLAPIWKFYGVAPQGDEFDHTARVLLIDRSGRQRIAFPIDQLTPEALAHDIAKLEAEPS